jgi:hypothetical protein
VINTSKIKIILKKSLSIKFAFRLVFNHNRKFMFTYEDMQNTTYQAYMPLKPSFGYATGNRIRNYHASQGIEGTFDSDWYPGREVYQLTNKGEAIRSHPCIHHSQTRTITRPSNPIIREPRFGRFIPSLLPLYPPPNRPLPALPLPYTTSSQHQEVGRLP